MPVLYVSSTSCRNGITHPVPSIVWEAHSHHFRLKKSLQFHKLNCHEFFHLAWWEWRFSHSTGCAIPVGTMAGDAPQLNVGTRRQAAHDQSRGIRETSPNRICHQNLHITTAHVYITMLGHSLSERYKLELFCSTVDGFSVKHQLIRGCSPFCQAGPCCITFETVACHACNDQHASLSCKRSRTGRSMTPRNDQTWYSMMTGLAERRTPSYLIPNYFFVSYLKGCSTCVLQWTMNSTYHLNISGLRDIASIALICTFWACLALQSSLRHWFLDGKGKWGSKHDKSLFYRPPVDTQKNYVKYDRRTVSAKVKDYNIASPASLKCNFIRFSSFFFCNFVFSFSLVASMLSCVIYQRTWSK